MLSHENTTAALDAILTCSRLLMNEPDESQAIEEVLRAIRRYYAADQVNLYEPSEKGAACWKTTFQCPQATPASDPETSCRLPALPLRRWSELFREHPSLTLPRLLAQCSPGEPDSLSLRPFLAVPLRKRGALTGCLSVHNPQSHGEEDALLLAVSAALSEHLNHGRAENHLPGRLAEYRRKNDFYQAMLSETLAFAEVSLDSGCLDAARGLWRTFPKGENFFQAIQQKIPRLVASEDLADCQKYFDLTWLKSQYRQGSSSQRCHFRLLIDSQYRWVELVTHIFPERSSRPLYVLLYLNDIDARKKRELAQESAANLDPLTGLLNRRAFERETRDFMGQPHSSGALLILDLDDFKSINDTYGHPAGDVVLKSTAETLLSTFRSHDIIGRFGGDEFILFLKSVTSRKILDRRISQLLGALSQSQPFPLTCSVGITFTDCRNFSYHTCLSQADTALYQSKQQGKNTYRYFEIAAGEPKPLS